MTRQLAPAISGHLAILGIQANNDMATKSRTGILQKAWVSYSGRANDDIAQTSIQITFDRVQIANAATQLDINLTANGLEDLANGRLIFGLPGKCTVQINQMNPARPLVNPVPRHH